MLVLSVTVVDSISNFKTRTKNGSICKGKVQDWNGEGVKMTGICKDRIQNWNVKGHISNHGSILPSDTVGFNFYEWLTSGLFSLASGQQ